MDGWMDGWIHRQTESIEVTACDRTLNRGRLIYRQVWVGCVFAVVWGGEGCKFLYDSQSLTNLPVSPGFFFENPPPLHTLTHTHTRTHTHTHNDGDT